jgi:signal transduction histidine kinase
MPAGRYACLEIADTGSGIAKGDLEKIFEPFYTTKDVGEGTGLGLSIAHGIIAEHGGWIEAESEAGVGTRLTICLPEGPEVRPDTDAQPGAS